MSDDWSDLGYEDYLRHLEYKKRYETRNLLMKQIQNNDSDFDKALYKQIAEIDADIKQLIEDDQESGKELEEWMKKWEECTPELIRKMFNIVSDWKDLTIGFSKNDINVIRCIHPEWGKKFDAHDDFNEIKLIKFEDGEYSTTVVYDLMRTFADSDEIEDEKRQKKDAVLDVNKLLKSLFRLNKNPIAGKTIGSYRDEKFLYKSLITFKYLD